MKVCGKMNQYYDYKLINVYNISKVGCDYVNLEKMLNVELVRYWR